MPMENAANQKPTLAERLLVGQPVALARAIRLIEAEAPAAPSLLQAIRPHLGQAAVAGLTGPPWVGKSFLVNAFVKALRERGTFVGVVAVASSCPVTGGAVLCDRIRMAGHMLDNEVLSRSLAARGHLGGLSVPAARVSDLMDTAGFDVVIQETAGAGQSEVELAELTNVFVLVSAPGLGNDVQATKAGMLEITHVLLVNKSDLPLARRTQHQLEAMPGLRAQSDWKVRVLVTKAFYGSGLPELAEAVARRISRRAPKSGREVQSGRSRRLLGPKHCAPGRKPCPCRSKRRKCRGHQRHANL